MSAPVQVHAEAARATSGGGLTYAVAIAAALAEAVPVELHLPFRTTADELATWLPDWPRSLALPAPRPPNRGPVEEWRRAGADRSRSVVVRETSHIPPLTRSRDSVLVTSFPFTAARRRRDRVRVASYGRVVVNSRFTAGAVAQRWHRDAQVLHPPIEPVAPREKRPWILGVGRFTGGGRSKCQVEMVDTFRALGPEVHRTWELHLAGFVEDPGYLAAVRRRAAGLPVHVHPDVERPSLERLYGSSSLFWHACGLGVDERREPHRVEHFGLTTAEAMSAGCVPVVIGAGGQPEIVGTDGLAGALWQDPEQWLDRTVELVGDPVRRAACADRARERAAGLSFAAFAPRARTLILGA